MNSFAPIAKVRSLDVEELQRELAKGRNELTKTKARVSMLKNQLRDLEPPTSGTMSELANFKMSQSLFRAEIAREEKLIKVIKDVISQIRDNLKKAQVEFEKIDYLSKDFEAKKIARIKRSEELQLEEAGINSHIYKNGRAI